ncbi:MAG: hypothetical protein SVY10_13335 [Thermodesulfobacteriota bacterium]|nr:hypothetical protein [Thermodesulfobacteriota bacterium]
MAINKERNDMDSAEHVRPDPSNTAAYADQLTRDAEAAVKSDSLSLYQRVQTMSIPDKIQLALKGNKEARELLLRDSNKLVSTSVIRSPKITESEIQQIAQSRNVVDEILRMIAKNKEWMSKRKIKLALVNNPKTPLDISLKLLGNMREKELTHLAKNKEIPTTLCKKARQLLDQRFK